MPNSPIEHGPFGLQRISTAPARSASILACAPAWPSEPFFTTKDKDKGTGLGLATVYGIIKQSGGYIWVYSELDHGTAFKIYLPRIEVAASQTRSIDRGDASSPHGHETILVVEDDALLREVSCDLLRLTGYLVLSAASPDEALQLTADHVGPIDFILTDMMMPKMNGRELVVKLEELGHCPKVLYVSGYTDVVMGGVHGTQKEMLAFLQKPYTRLALTTKVREILDAP